MNIVTEAALAAGSIMIAHFEGTVLHAYPDIRGVWTIGCGNTTLLDGTPVTKDTPPITLAEANDLREKTLREKVAPRLDALITKPLLDRQVAPLLSLVWNIGNTAFADSTIRRQIDADLLTAAGNGFRVWCNVDGVYCPPLYKRRLAERDYWFDGDIDKLLGLGLAGMMKARIIQPAAAPAPASDGPTADELNDEELKSLGG